MENGFDKETDLVKDSIDVDNINTKQDFKSFVMDDSGKIRRSGTNGIVVSGASRTYITLGWIFAALTILISPYFSAAGITFGLLANRQNRGSGNYIIIANIVFALINFIFGVFLVMTLKEMFLG